MIPMLRSTFRYLPYIGLMTALCLSCWSFIQSERYRRNTEMVHSQTYEIQWRSTQLREWLARMSGSLRLANATGTVPSDIHRQMQLAVINVEQLLALDYVGRYLPEDDLERLMNVRDTITERIEPIAADRKGFDKSLVYLGKIEDQVYEVTGTAVAHGATLTKATQIEISASRNKFLFWLALALIAIIYTVIHQRNVYARREEKILRSSSSLFGHMTRSRVTALRLFLDHLRENPSLSPEMLQAARQAVRELDSINDGLLNISYGERDPRTEPVERILTRLTAGRSLPIDTELRGVAADALVPATQFHMIVDELLHNAEAAVKGRCDARIKIRAHLGARRLLITRTLILEVADNGPGMDHGVLEKATMPFFSTKAGRHVGLGLTGCAQMVSTLKGKLRIESTIGKGTLVRIVLPFSSPAQGREP